MTEGGGFGALFYAAPSSGSPLHRFAVPLPLVGEDLARSHLRFPVGSTSNITMIIAECPPAILQNLQDGLAFATDRAGERPLVQPR